jgi:hydrogenase nickel incorporation protein HypA/HybF
MHELSLVRSIFSTLEQELTTEALQKVMQVDLKIGLLANVEPILLQNAFSAFQQENRKYEQVKLNTQLIGVMIYCNDCDQESPVSNYIFRCAQCGKPSRDIRSGEELLIHQIHYLPT